MLNKRTRIIFIHIQSRGWKQSLLWMWRAWRCEESSYEAHWSSGSTSDWSPVLGFCLLTSYGDTSNWKPFVVVFKIKNRVMCIRKASTEKLWLQLSLTGSESWVALEFIPGRLVARTVFPFLVSPLQGTAWRQWAESWGRPFSGMRTAATEWYRRRWPPQGWASRVVS